MREIIKNMTSIIFVVYDFDEILIPREVIR